MGSVTFRLEAQEASAVQGFLRLVDAQRQSEQGFDRNIKKGNVFQQVGKAVTGSLMGFAGSLGAMFGVSRIVSGMADGLSEARAEARAFEEEMTGLLSIEDNLKNIGSVKGSVLNLSSGLGMDRKEVLGAMFDIQSGASNLSKSLQDDVLRSALDLTRVTGTLLPDSVKVLLKSFLVYEDELKSVERASSKLFKSAELGWMEFDEMAQYLPDVIAPAKALGFTFDDVNGALITATQLGGKNQKTFTGLRNVFLKMEEAQKKGLTTGGTFLKQMQDLSRVDANVLADVFGVESITVIANLAQNADLLAQAIRDIEQAGKGLVEGKLLQRMADPAYRAAEREKIIDQTMKNQPLSEEWQGKWNRLEEDYKLRQLGARQELGPLFGFLSKPAAWLGTVGDVLGDKLPGGNAMRSRFMPEGDMFLNVGRDLMEQQMERAGARRMGEVSSLERSGGAGMAERYIERLIAALESNTAATERDANALERGRAMGRNAGVP